MSETGIETFQIVWHAITIDVHFERKWLSGYTAHLTVESVHPRKAKLPITETGYKSHFCPAEFIDGHGGPVAFVTAWLDEAAKSPLWAERRQLSLF